MGGARMRYFESKKRELHYDRSMACYRSYLSHDAVQLILRSKIVRLSITSMYQGRSPDRWVCR